MLNRKINSVNTNLIEFAKQNIRDYDQSYFIDDKEDLKQYPKIDFEDLLNHPAFLTNKLGIDTGVCLIFSKNEQSPRGILGTPFIGLLTHPGHSWVDFEILYGTA